MSLVVIDWKSAVLGKCGDLVGSPIIQTNDSAAICEVDMFTPRAPICTELNAPSTVLLRLARLVVLTWLMAVVVRPAACVVASSDSWPPERLLATLAT